MWANRSQEPPGFPWWRGADDGSGGRRRAAAPGHSVIGDGGIVGDGDHIGSADPDPDVSATAGNARTDACEPLAGAVTAADSSAALAGQTPQDRKPQRQPQNPPSRLGAFDHWLDFTPELTTSPTHQDALIAQLPTDQVDVQEAQILSGQPR